jgi:hypothetical protein
MTCPWALVDTLFGKTDFPSLAEWHQFYAAPFCLRLRINQHGLIDLDEKRTVNSF